AGPPRSGTSRVPVTRTVYNLSGTHPRVLHGLHRAGQRIEAMESLDLLIPEVDALGTVEWDDGHLFMDDPLKPMVHELALLLITRRHRLLKEPRRLCVIPLAPVRAARLDLASVKVHDGTRRVELV